MTDPTPVLALIDAFRHSQAMFTAVELGVFDRLAEQPSTADRLAQEIAVQEDVLTRLLDGCVGLGLLLRENGEYRNSPAAEAFLCRRSPTAMTGYIDYSRRVLWQLWSHLDDAVREGSHRWTQSFGLAGPLFSHFFRSEEAKREFLMGMHGFGMLASPTVVATADLTPFRHLVDLGGATGHLAAAAVAHYPTLTATVFDLPGTQDLARELTANDRVALVAGDFFLDPLPPGDLYALGRILHDWTEEKIHLLLARIYEALPAGGGILIVEKLLDDDKLGPLAAQMQSLNMLVCTEGKERTLAEYTALLTTAGFTNVQGWRTGKPVDAILARKPMTE